MDTWKHDAKLSHAEYLSNFWSYFDQPDVTLRKIEAGQVFAEPGNPSWEAFADGDWNRAMQLIASRAEETQEYFHGLADLGKEAKRVRIVAKPYSAYLIWEMHVLRLNQQLGEEIRVVPISVAREQVTPVWIDDFTALSEDVAYRVTYDRYGVNDGAEASYDSQTIQRVLAAFETLFMAGEPMLEFFDREIANLESPY